MNHSQKFRRNNSFRGKTKPYYMRGHSSYTSRNRSPRAHDRKRCSTSSLPGTGDTAPARIDPMFIAAATAAMMNERFTQGGFPSTRSSDPANVAAVATAAMNAAAMAAALGAGVRNQNFQNTDNRTDYRRNSPGRFSRGSSHRWKNGGSRPNKFRGRSRSPARDTRRNWTGRGKFPHHLDHVDPEEDRNATRTLFVGNLNPNIRVDELRRLFEKYGLIEHIDVKRRDSDSVPSTYAFIRFINLDMAHRAKVAISGRTINGYTYKIGYGKVSPTRCLWIGGLGPWITYQNFTNLLDRFGPPERVVWATGRNYANVLFRTIGQAKTAADALRGYPLGGNDRRIRVDYTDESHIFKDSNFDHRRQTNRSRSPIRSGRYPASRPGSSRGPRSGSYRSSRHQQPLPEQSNESHNNRTKRRSSSLQKRSPSRNSLSCSPKSAHYSRSPVENCSKTPPSFESPLTSASIREFARNLSIAWDGAFFLKSSGFPCQMFLLRGDQNLVDQFMPRQASTNDDDPGCDSTNLPSTYLHITQRMKLDPVTLDDINQRISSAGNSGFCVLLAAPSVGLDSSTTIKQSHRPLRSLVTYLRSKDSAGVVLLNPLDQASTQPTLTSSSDGLQVTGVLHAFPPCSFASSLLKDFIDIPKDYSKDDYLVVLLIQSSGT